MHPLFLEIDPCDNLEIALARLLRELASARLGLSPKLSTELHCTRPLCPGIRGRWAMPA